MIEDFDPSLEQRLSEDESLIISVNGEEIPPTNGFILVAGKIGTLGLCADGRSEFLLYPPKFRPNVKDQFTLITNKGKRISMTFWHKNGQVYSAQG